MGIIFYSEDRNEVRCDECNKLFCKNLKGSMEVVCSRCRTYHKFDSAAYKLRDGGLTIPKISV
jgi:phage FluMu protein Com